jgi:hypothetical protein
MERIKDVEREHHALRLAVDRLLVFAKSQPDEFQGEVNLRIIMKASVCLEGTYLVRLFAEFETALRLFWAIARKTAPPSRTRDLLEGIASTRQVRLAQTANAHLVREYRNVLVHHQDKVIAPIPISEARSHLCRYFSFLPPTW